MNEELGKLILNTMFTNVNKDNNNSNNTFEEDMTIDPRKNRLFTPKQKELCWNKAKKIPERDPDRWRYDASGNAVVKALRGCQGPLCHEYDHIVPFSKGGGTTVRNCQILQTYTNRYKGNRVDMDEEKMKIKSIKMSMTQYDMDLIEESIYGNVNKFI